MPLQTALHRQQHDDIIETQSYEQLETTGLAGGFLKEYPANRGLGIARQVNTVTPKGEKTICLKSSLS